MNVWRSVAPLPSAPRRVAMFSLLASAALACSAPPGVGEADDGAPPFTGLPGGAGSSNAAGGAGPLVNGSGGTGASPVANAGSGSLPVGGTGNGSFGGSGSGLGGTSSGTAGTGSGTAGTGNGAAGTGSGAAGTSSGTAGTSGGTAGDIPLPDPPGEAFFFDDFEGSALDQSPANWDYFIAYVANQNNPSGGASALVDDTRAVSGTHSVHFVGGQQPAQITLPLPDGTNRLFVRAMVFMTRQLGANNNPMPNHETLIGIRGTPGQANSEVRFGEIKGVIGTNEVPSDNISPRQDQWGLGPAVAPNQWHCFEVQFLGDQPDNQLFAYVDGELVHSVTAPDQWNNGNLGGNWMAGKFEEVILGWHSFSGVNTDVWMDDIVLSTSPIGCD